MSTEEQTAMETQITTKPEVEKPKNPKRVAQGKKLAEISKAAKERKRAKIQQESETSSSLQLPSLSTSLAIVGTTTGVIGTYIAWKNFQKNKAKPVSQLPKISEEEAKYNNLDDDDI